MWYKEALAMRRPLIVYAIVVATIAALNAWGAGDSGSIYVSQAIDVGCFFAIVLALVVGSNLGRERGAQAGSALLRPVSRERYAWTVLGVGMFALVVAYFAGIVIFVGTYQVAHGLPPMDMRGVTVITAIFLPLGAILAFYGLAAACAVATRAAVAWSILLGPICLVLWVGAEIYAWPAGKVFRVLCFVNPLIYVAAAIAQIERQAHPATIAAANGSDYYAALSTGVDSIALFVIAAIALHAAAYLWKHAEV
jgi:hypothetical protein